MRAPHQGNIGMSELDGGLRAMTLDEQKQKRKRNGRCPTCGEVQTHIAGLWKKWLLMPQVNNIYLIFLDLTLIMWISSQITFHPIITNDLISLNLKNDNRP